MQCGRGELASCVRSITPLSRQRDCNNPLPGQRGITRVAKLSRLLAGTCVRSGTPAYPFLQVATQSPLHLFADCRTLALVHHPDPLQGCLKDEVCRQGNSG